MAGITVGIRAIGLLGGLLGRILGAGLDLFLGPSSLAFCFSLGGDAFCAGEMRRQELSGSVQRRGPFVEDRGIGLEDVRDPGGDVKGDLDVGGGGLPREADGVVEENLVTSRLDDQGGRLDRSANTGLMRPRAASSPDV
jgi:hypothetical protein